MNAPHTAAHGRLAPDAANFRLLVYAFYRDYIGMMGESPSYGEAANRFKTNRDRVKRAVDALVREGLFIRMPGARGVRLPSMRDEAIRQLRLLGYVVDEDIGKILPPGANLTLTKSTLLPAPELDYPEDGDRTGADGRQHGERAGESEDRAA